MGRAVGLEEVGDEDEEDSIGDMSDEDDEYIVDVVGVVVIIALAQISECVSAWECNISLDIPSLGSHHGPDGYDMWDVGAGLGEDFVSVYGPADLLVMCLLKSKLRV